MKTTGKTILMLAVAAFAHSSTVAQSGRTTTTTTVTSGSAGAGTTTVRPNETMDGRFVGKIIALNAYEIRLLQLATGMSRRQDLKDHAKHMLEDHQKLDQQVRAYATSRGYTSMEKKDAKYDEKIAKRAGRPAGLEWDKDILEDLVDAHEDGIEMMRKERKNLSDQQLVAIVDAALPKMEEHLAMLKPLESGAKEAVRTNDTTAGNHSMHMNSNIGHQGHNHGNINNNSGNGSSTDTMNGNRGGNNGTINNNGIRNNDNDTMNDDDTINDGTNNNNNGTMNNNNGTGTNNRTRTNGDDRNKTNMNGTQNNNNGTKNKRGNGTNHR